jgi:GT2 family glycosyltransferase
MSSGADGRVAAVMITFNRREEVLRTLEHMTALPERPRVVVVDNGSTDGTAGAVGARFPGVEVLRSEANLGAAGRTLGVRRVGAPYVAFCDDDTWWDPGSLARAADLLDAHPGVAALTGHILVEPGGRDDPINLDMRESPLPRDPGLPGYPLVSFLAGASVVRRSAYLEVGGFEPRLFLGGEEELLATDFLAAGWALRHVPELVVHHHPSTARDAHHRRWHGIRNTLWVHWLRRPWRSALRRTARMLRNVPKDGVTARGLAEAVRGLPWVLRNRRVVPPEVERWLRLMDEPQMGSRARRYVS